MARVSVSHEMRVEYLNVLQALVAVILRPLLLGCTRRSWNLTPHAGYSTLLSSLMIMCRRKTLQIAGKANAACFCTWQLAVSPVLTTNDGPPTCSSGIGHEIYTRETALLGGSQPLR